MKSEMKRYSRQARLKATLWLLLGLWASVSGAQTTGPSPYWKNQISFPDDVFLCYGQESSVRWIKFTIPLAPYEPNVYFQDSKKYMFHYNFGVTYLTPFNGMTTQQFNEVTLFKANQQAVLGTVIFPPTSGTPPVPLFEEYGIQFVRQDPYEREQIRDMFNLVKARVAAAPDVQALYLPTFEQQAQAEADRDWLESQGILLGSTARWIEGNVCYAPGWAIGRVKFVAADRIIAAYDSGELEPQDILLTDGIPAELPFLAGILSLAPSTPNSHVALLARSYGVPFAYAALADDAQRAQQLIGRKVIYSAYDGPDGRCDLRLIDAEDSLDDATTASLLQLKKPSPLDLLPMKPYGALATPTEPLVPDDVQYVGGKACNFGILRAALPNNSPKAAALTFDLWNAFLDQPVASVCEIVLGPGEYVVIWADDDEKQGPLHAGFGLSKGGESVALFDRDGVTRIDAITFGPQTKDVSYGRSVDAGDAWQTFASPTPGRANDPGQSRTGPGLVINEFMADNKRAVEDPCRPGSFPDWIELYNASDQPITLNGLYLTDDVNRPTKWQIPAVVTGPTLRQEILRRLSAYTTYPVASVQALAAELASIRSLFTNELVVPWDASLRQALIDALADPKLGLDPNVPLRFRSSTNVEDRADFIGAGLYESYSGCLADDMDDDGSGPCACDPNKETEDSALEAIRQVFASFYNDNAYLERVRHEVNEANVGMAVLVHHSFPDEIELANGVATVERKGDTVNTVITLVTQPGAVSVTNPVDASVPEEVVVEVLPSGYVKLTPASLKVQSSRIPQGRTVLTWMQDYKDLVALLMKVSGQYSQVTGKKVYTLDLEYKKVAPCQVMPAGGLVVKQVRQVPTPAQVTPFLIDIPAQFEVFTGEFEIMEPTDVFADHRLKSRWTLETQNMVLDANNLAVHLYGKVRMEYVDGDQIHTIEQDMSLLPLAAHAFDAGKAETTDSWQLADLANPRVYNLTTTQIPTQASPTQNPIITLADLGTNARNIMGVYLPYKCLTLKVHYAEPVASWNQQALGSGYSSSLRTTTENRVYLWSPPGPEPEDIYQERSFASDGVSIRASFFNPPPPAGFDSWALATAPLKRWDRTVIEGLTTEPIVLQGYWSQTYRPEHHNQVENFLFEPRLEPGLSPEVLAQLKDKGVTLIHLMYDNTGGGDSQIATYDFK